MWHSAAGARRPATPASRPSGERDEAADLSGRLALERRLDADVDARRRQAEPGELSLEHPCGRGAIVDHAEREDLRALPRLPHLVLDDARNTREHRAEDVRVDEHPAAVREQVVETALDVGDQ